MKKHYRNKLAVCGFAIAFLATLAMPFSAQAASKDFRNSASRVLFIDTVTRMEETEWVYRLYNGELQKRLWSNTYAIWLTGWIKA